MHQLKVDLEETHQLKEDSEETPQLKEDLEETHQPKEDLAEMRHHKAEILDQDQAEAPKMNPAKKEIIVLFPVSQKLTTQSSLRFQRHLSTATTKSSQDITLMSRPDAKSSISAHWTEPSTSCAPTEPSSLRNISFACGGTSLIATPLQVSSERTQTFMTIQRPEVLLPAAILKEETSDQALQPRTLEAAMLEDQLRLPLEDKRLDHTQALVVPEIKHLILVRALQLQDIRPQADQQQDIRPQADQQQDIPPQAALHQVSQGNSKINLEKIRFNLKFLHQCERLSKRLPINGPISGLPSSRPSFPNIRS